MKGISKLKKDDLVILAKKEWQALCSLSYCETSGSAADEDLFGVPSLIPYQRVASSYHHLLSSLYHH